ncbi:TrmH family RNA methyltransferase [Salinimicrobium tongyeongense]|uniref:TrmH family RNA methyltransferase n=1 Tax=Salinimicrobium tongyeongense TaxID=2809707 RepID=A0ABY6NQM0_9FLAO|nr:TrmH family RNA methyltransferase [Salinimicrobium tongyeongense]UZH55217.1 TrmH family RNA methyltransferase [Salinimicrobium tongyeongense]
MQATHHTTPFQKKQFPIVLVLDAITSPANIGSFFRLGDAFGIEKMLICESSADLQSNRLKRTARATIKNVTFEERENSEAACRELKAAGYKIVAIEVASESIPIEKCHFRAEDKIALVLGNERLGIKKELLELADNLLHINMFGENSSMNVTHAAAIALFEITKRLQPVP